MNLFLTVGAQMPFDRLVVAIDAWAGRHPDVSITAQIGATDYVPKNLVAHRSLAPVRFEAACDAADAIVGHAGIGTLFAALERGKPVLVLPRRATLRETRNEHQVATARRFGARRSVVVAWETSELDGAMETLLARVGDAAVVAEPARTEGPLFEALRRFVDGDARALGSR